MSGETGRGRQAGGGIVSGSAARGVRPSCGSLLITVKSLLIDKGVARGASKTGNCRNLHQGWRDGWHRGRKFHDLVPGVAVGLALWMEFSTIGVGAPKRQQLQEVRRRLRQ